MAIRRAPRTPPRNVFGMLTVAPEMNDFFETLEKAARAEASVLIRGETGTGKELAARAIHQLSRRDKAPFYAVNCASLTGEMLASELFGHVRGAFTGAVRDRKGLFRLADQGTVFLDEIAEMPLDIQARLLRVLQEREFIPLGGSEKVSIDVRVVSATHVSLRDAADANKFRRDLMFRIRVLPIFLPALRERSGDIEALAFHLIGEFSKSEGDFAIEGIEADAFDALVSYDWPGNVRELRNVMEYAVVMTDGPIIGLDALPPELRGEAPPNQKGSPAPSEVERMRRALTQAQGDREQAAEILGMSRSTLWRKMREANLSWPRAKRH